MPSGWAPGSCRLRSRSRATQTGDVALVSFDVQTVDGTSCTSTRRRRTRPTRCRPRRPTWSPVPRPPCWRPPPRPLRAAPPRRWPAARPRRAARPPPRCPPCVIVGAVDESASIKNTDPNGNGNSATNVGVLTTAADHHRQTCRLLHRARGPCRHRGAERRAVPQLHAGERDHVHRDVPRLPAGFVRAVGRRPPDHHLLLTDRRALRLGHPGREVTCDRTEARLLDRLGSAAPAPTKAPSCRWCWSARC